MSGGTRVAYLTRTNGCANSSRNQDPDRVASVECFATHAPRYGHHFNNHLTRVVSCVRREARSRSAVGAAGTQAASAMSRGIQHGTRLPERGAKALGPSALVFCGARRCRNATHAVERTHAPGPVYTGWR